MKYVHLFAVVSLVAPVILAVTGLSGAAAFVLGLGVVVEIIGSALTGKQSNDGVR